MLKWKLFYQVLILPLKLLFMHYDFKKANEERPAYKHTCAFSSLPAETKASLISADCDLGIGWAANEFRMGALPFHVKCGLAKLHTMQGKHQSHHTTESVFSTKKSPACFLCHLACISKVMTISLRTLFQISFWHHTVQTSKSYPL